MEARPAPSSLAYKLNRLFQTIHPASRGEYRAEEVARAIDGLGGDRILPAYIYTLCKGQRDNPTKKHVELLASFFGVSPAYCFDEAAAQRIKQQPDLLAAFRDGVILRLAARARGSSPASLTGIPKLAGGPGDRGAARR